MSDSMGKSQETRRKRQLATGAAGLWGRQTHYGLFPADKDRPLRYPAAFCGVS
jgi:hypothetical protein